MSLLKVLWTVAVWWIGFFLIAKIIEFVAPNFFWRIVDRLHITTLRLGYIKWFTTALNQKFVSIGTAYRKFLYYWFTVGVTFGGLSMILSFVVLILNLFWTLRKPTAKVQLLTPIIPGVNIPATQLIYCLSSLFICGLFHEFGHALAAVVTNRRVNGFGVFLLFIYPGAFVDISHEVNERVNDVFGTLKIICAGCWHNIVLAFLGFLLLQFHHFLVSPLFIVPQRGVVVIDIHKSSVLEGHLHSTDIITHLNDCEINNLDDWNTCFYKMYHSNFTALNYCVNKATIDDGEKLSTECCTEVFRHEPSKSTMQCWEVMTNEDKQFSMVESHHKTQFCYTVRKIVNERTCKSNVDCKKDEFCVHPVLPPQTMIIRIRRVRGEDIFFAGDPIALYQMIQVSVYNRRWSWLIFLPLDFPNILYKFLTYMISISGALALLNMAPVYYLDGEHALRGFVSQLFRLSHEKLDMICQIVFRITSVLLLLNFIVSLAVLYLQ